MAIPRVFALGANAVQNDRADIPSGLIVKMKIENHFFQSKALALLQVH